MELNGKAGAFDSPGADTPIDARTAGTGDNAEAPAPGAAVDLAAWGRGERHYTLDEVRRAIDAHIDEQINREIERMVGTRFVSVGTARDAVEWLIKEGLIQAADARTDI